MPRALGINAVMLFGWEDVAYGTAATNYKRVPFISANLGDEQPLIEDDILGLGRDPSEPLLDVITNGGSITVPLDLRHIGFWLRLLFGSPTTTDDTPGSGDYTHVFASGAAALPSASIEIGFPDIGEYFLNTGIMAQSIRIELSPTGRAQAVIELVGQQEARSGSSVDGTPIDASAVARFNQFQGSIDRNNSALAAIVSSGLTFSNGLDPVRVVRNDGLIDGVDALKTSIQGNISARFQDTTLYNDAGSTTPIEIDLAYTRAADEKLTFTVHEARLPKARQNIAGAGGVEATYNYQAQKDESAGEMLEVTLIDDVAGDYDTIAAS